MLFLFGLIQSSSSPNATKSLCLHLLHLSHMSRTIYRRESDEHAGNPLNSRSYMYVHDCKSSKSARLLALPATAGIVLLLTLV